MQSGNVEELNSRLCKIEYQINRLSQLPKSDRVEKHIHDLIQHKDSLTKTIESYDNSSNTNAQKRSIKSNRNEYLIRTGNIQTRVYNNDSRISGILNHFDTTPLQNISKDIKEIVAPEFEKTIHIYSLVSPIIGEDILKTLILRMRKTRKH